VAPPREPTCSVSVVSHGQGALVAALLDDLDRSCGVDLEVIVTVNVPEDEAYLAARRRFPVTVVRNAAPRGFGANHNAAFTRSSGGVFVVVNPDIRFVADPLPPLLETLRRKEVGVCGPKVVSPAGTLEDSARRFPTAATLLARRLLDRRSIDYRIGAEPIPVDWLAGMFVACRRETFADLGGFDARYFLYFEDVDLCRRAREEGLDVVLDPRSCVVHDARRGSHRSLKHLAWHVRGALRYLTTPRSRRWRVGTGMS